MVDDVARGAGRAAGRRECERPRRSPDPTADIRRSPITTPTRRYGPLRLALAGRHQVDNAVVAVRLLEVAAARGICLSPATRSRAGLADARWPGRLEELDTPRGRTADRRRAQPGWRARAGVVPRRTLHPAACRWSWAMMADKARDRCWRAGAVARPLVFTRAPGARAADPRRSGGIARAVAPGIDVSSSSPTIEAALGARVVARTADRRGWLALSGRRRAGAPGRVDRINACGKVGLRCSDCSSSCRSCAIALVFGASARLGPGGRLPAHQAWTIDRVGKDHVKLVGQVEIDCGDQSFAADEVELFTDTHGSSPRATSSSPRAPTVSRPTASTTTPRRARASSTTRRARRC